MEKICPGCKEAISENDFWAHVSACAPKYNEIMRERVPELWSPVEGHPDLLDKVLRLSSELQYGATFDQLCRKMPMIWGIHFLAQNGLSYY